MALLLRLPLRVNGPAKSPIRKTKRKDGAMESQVTTSPRVRLQDLFVPLPILSMPTPLQVHVTREHPHLQSDMRHYTSLHPHPTTCPSRLSMLQLQTSSLRGAIHILLKYKVLHRMVLTINNIMVHLILGLTLNKTPTLNLE